MILRLSTSERETSNALRVGNAGYIEGYWRGAVSFYLTRHLFFVCFICLLAFSVVVVVVYSLFSLFIFVVCSGVGRCGHCYACVLCLYSDVGVSLLVSGLR